MEIASADALASTLNTSSPELAVIVTAVAACDCATPLIVMTAFPLDAEIVTWLGVVSVSSHVGGPRGAPGVPLASARVVSAPEIAVTALLLSLEIVVPAGAPFVSSDAVLPAEAPVTPPPAVTSPLFAVVEPGPGVVFVVGWTSVVAFGPVPTSATVFAAPVVAVTTTSVAACPFVVTAGTSALVESPAPEVERNFKRGCGFAYSGSAGAAGMVIAGSVTVPVAESEPSAGIVDAPVSSGGVVPSVVPGCGASAGGVATAAGSDWMLSGVPIESSTTGTAANGSFAFLVPAFDVGAT